MKDGLGPWPDHMRVAVAIYGVGVVKADTPRRTIGRSRVGPKESRRAKRVRVSTWRRERAPGESFKAWALRVSLPAMVLSREWVKHHDAAIG